MQNAIMKKCLMAHEKRRYICVDILNSDRIDTQTKKLDKTSQMLLLQWSKAYNRYSHLRLRGMC